MAPFLWWAWTDEVDADKREKAEQSPEDTKMGEARYACQKAIETSLHNPETAEWGWRSDNWFQTWPATIDGDIVTVRPKFRASNAMGGTVLTTWLCKIHITDDNWTFLELKEL